MRKGDRALYYWIYPNFMINWYDGVMDTNLVVPRGVDQTEVIFDFYFPDVVSRQKRASATSRASKWANAFRTKTSRSASQFNAD